MVGMLDSLSLKNTKLGLETLELMGYKRDAHPAWSSTGPTPTSASPRTTSSAIVGRSPDVLVPSHRDVVRSVNEGTPIVQSRPRTEVAQSFRALADLYLGTEVTRSRAACG